MKVVVALLLLPALAGCYLLTQADGQLQVGFYSRPIGEALAHPSIPPEQKAKLRLVLEIKEFGESQMGLARTKNYSTYFDTGGRPITTIVSACQKDRFEAVTWSFPIIGTVPYKGFFSEEDARAEAAALEAEGLDVYVRGAGAYSTLGWFTDPVLSTMLDASEDQLASLILHEMTHVTLWLPGGVGFNESLAEFVGQQGSLEFVKWRYGSRSPEYDRAVRSIAESEREDPRSEDLFRKLHDLYSSSLTRERKLEMRDVVAGFSVNNAEVLARRVYGSHGIFRALHERVGGDWRRFFKEARAGAEKAAP